MADFYYPSFELKTTEADGYTYPLAGEDVNVHNVTKDTAIGTLTSDANGIIAEGSYDSVADSVSLFDVIEITHAIMTGSARFVLQETQEKAFTAAENDVSTLILDDSFTDTIEPQTVNVFAVDLGVADAVPVFIGQAKVGTTTKFQYKQTKEQNLRVYTSPVTDSFQASANDLSKLPFADVSIPGLTDQAYRRLFEYYANVECNPGFDLDAFTSTIAADTLDVDGDTIKAEYAGVASKDTNVKAIKITFAGENIFASGNINNADFSDWAITVHVIRSSQTTARCKVVMTSDFITLTAYRNIAADLDFTTDEDLILTIYGDTDPGDIRATLGTVDLIPAAPVNYALTDLGVSLTDGSVVLTDTV